MDENLIEDLSSYTPIDEYTEDDLYKDLAKVDSRNVIVNKFKNFIEVSVYKKPFFISTNNYKKVDRSRKFKYDENEQLQIAKENVSFSDLIDSNVRSRRRSLDNFFGYALSNSWKYFITLTFDPKKINRSKRSDVNKAWELLRKKLQYKYPNIKILLISEEHKTDGCLHFHGLIGACDISYMLDMAINNKKYLSHYDYKLHKKVYDYDPFGNLIPNKYYGQLLKTKYGDQIYNFKQEFFNYGFTEVIKLHDEDLPGDNDKIVFYLQKYMSKDNNSVDYNKRAYYRTLNLDFKEKYVTKSFDPNTGIVLNELMEKNKIIKKENSKLIVYLIKTEKDYTKNNLYSEEYKAIQNFCPSFVDGKKVEPGSLIYANAYDVFKQ